MKTKIVLLGLLMASAVAASLQAAPSQSGPSGRAASPAYSGKYTQWAQKQRHPTCICVINGYTFCMDATQCKKCAGECSW